MCLCDCWCVSRYHWNLCVDCVCVKVESILFVCLTLFFFFFAFFLFCFFFDTHLLRCVFPSCGSFPYTHKHLRPSNTRITTKASTTHHTIVNNIRFNSGCEWELNGSSIDNANHISTSRTESRLECH